MQTIQTNKTWFITGAAHPHCRLLVVLCRNADADAADSHRRHSMVLVPVDAPDQARLREIFDTVVLPRWISRCGASCADIWRRTIGPARRCRAPAAP